MRLDLVPAEHWDRLNDRLKQDLRLGDDEHARVHAGLGTAVFEAAIGLAQIFSHKRAIAVLKGNSPVFESVLPWFLKEAYQVQSGILPDLLAGDGLTAWRQGLKKETVFVLWSEDHPVTGETWDADAFDAALNEAKIYSLRVSHASFLGPRESIRPYSVRLCSVAPNLCVAITGARFKVPPMVAQLQTWNPAKVLQRLHDRMAEPVSDFLVEDFEKHFPDQAYFKKSQRRFHDRAVLVFPDVSGEALVRVLAEKLKLGTEPWAQMDTTNLCRWETVRLYKGWWLPAPSEEVLRGMVSFSPRLLERKEFVKEVQEAHQQVLSLQSW